MPSRTHPPSPLSPPPFHVILRFSGSYEDFRIFITCLPLPVLFLYRFNYAHDGFFVAFFFIPFFHQSLYLHISFPLSLFFLFIYLFFYVFPRNFPFLASFFFSLFKVIFNPPYPVFNSRLPFSFSPFLSSAQPINLFTFSLPFFTFSSSILPADILFLSSIFSIIYHSYVLLKL